MRYSEIKQLIETQIEESGFQHLNGLTVQSLDTFVKQNSKGEVQEEDVELDEAPGDFKQDSFGLGAPHRVAGPGEMQALMHRSKTKNKTKRDKFDYPYIHGSNIEITNDAGKPYDEERLKEAIMQRPSSLLVQNQKMQHSDGTTSIFYNVGLPALRGLAVNEQTGEFVFVNTCPGAGECKTFCYAMQGSYVMFKATSMKLARVLNYLLNDPEGFAQQMTAEIRLQQSKNRGSQINVRWHDAGDFFSPEYLQMAFKVAQDNPKVKFYAYTKMAGVAQSNCPPNFTMNYSGGALRSQEKQINFVRTKHSKVVPQDMFFDLIARDGNKLHKDAKGRTQFRGPQELNEFKHRLAQKYHIDPNTIITYDQMMDMPEGDQQKWNVIVVPGDGDDSAVRKDVLGSYLLFH